MPTVHVMTGLPGSGKTTAAKKIDAYRLCLDDYPAMLGLDPAQHSPAEENVAIDLMVRGAERLVAQNKDIVLDNTHLSERLPQLYRKVLNSYEVTWEVHDLTAIPIQQCVVQDASRPHPVGEAVIRRLARSLEHSRTRGWYLTADWLNTPRYDIQRYTPLPNSIPAIIVDLDGTVALHTDIRDHYDYTKVLLDRPHLPVINAVRALHQAGHRIIFLSGRIDTCRDDTLKWLNQYIDIPFEMLFMRSAEDKRPDWIIKYELFHQHIRNHYNVSLVLDDRNQVVQMWRRLGLICLQVADGDY